MLKALYEKQSYSTKDVINNITTSFYIVPLINACIRVGTMEEKEQMFRAFLESDEKIYYKKKEIYEEIEINTARLLGNLKAKQDRLRNKAMEAIKDKIEEKNLLQNKVLIVIVTDILHKNLTGVVANKIAEKYKRPTMLLRYKEEVGALTGSIRGYDKGEVKDFKSLLHEIELFDFVEGHPNAAGCQIDPNKLIEANERLNVKLKEVIVDADSYDVDFVVPIKNLESTLISEIDKFSNEWGHKVDEPLLAIKDVEVDSNEIYLNGKTSKSIKFICNGIEFIKFFSNEEEWETLKGTGNRIKLEVVGKCSINEYMGKKKPQIVVEAYNAAEVKKKKFNF